MVTDDDEVMVVDTTRGLYVLPLDNISDIPGYQETKSKNGLKSFDIDYDAIIWNDKLDLAENGIYMYGKKNPCLIRFMNLNI